MTTEEIDALVQVIGADALESYRVGNDDRGDALAFVVDLIREVEQTTAYSAQNN